MTLIVWLLTFGGRSNKILKLSRIALIGQSMRQINMRGTCGYALKRNFVNV